MNHKGKRFLITGASRGIGAEIAKTLSQQGAKLALTYNRNEDKIKDVLIALEGEGHFYTQLNNSSIPSIDKTFQMVLEKFEGRLDGLVNNAGATKDGLVLRMKEEDFDNILKTNLYGSFECTKRALTPMLKARSGSIVNLSSVVARTGNPGQANYVASKAGLEGFSRSVAKEVASRNIRINCVAPGFIQTDMTTQLTEKVKKELSSLIPMKKLGTSQDIAHSVSFLLSEMSCYITGQTLHVNGGMYMN